MKSFTLLVYDASGSGPKPSRAVCSLQSVLHHFWYKISFIEYGKQEDTKTGNLQIWCQELLSVPDIMISCQSVFSFTSFPERVFKLLVQHRASCMLGIITFAKINNNFKKKQKTSRLAGFSNSSLSLNMCTAYNMILTTTCSVLQEKPIHQPVFSLGFSLYAIIHLFWQAN